MQNVQNLLEEFFPIRGFCPRAYCLTTANEGNMTSQLQD